MTCNVKSLCYAKLSPINQLYLSPDDPTHTGGPGSISQCWQKKMVVGTCYQRLPVGPITELG